MEVLELLHRIALMVKTACPLLAAKAHTPAVNLLQQARDLLNEALDDIDALLEERSSAAHVDLHQDHHVI